MNLLFPKKASFFFLALTLQDVSTPTREPVSPSLIVRSLNHWTYGKSQEGSFEDPMRSVRVLCKMSSAS